MAYRNYSDEDKAAVLAHYEAAKSLRKTAAAFGIAVSVVHLWSKNQDAPSAPSPESVQEKKEDLADVFERLAYQATKHCADTMELAKPGEAALIAAQSVDKMRLLRDQSTSITEKVQPRSVEERDAMALELLEKVKLRMVG
jgi:transposase-like protein